MMKVGITGGIGSGKSYVCSLFKQRGLPVYDCDSEAKRLMVESEPLRQSIIALVGSDAYKHNDVPPIYNDEVLIYNNECSIYNNECEANRNPGTWTLNKPAVARYLFGSDSHAQAINAAVHPVVKADFARWAERQNSDIVLIESAILFESGFDDAVDKVIEVYAPKELRLRRAMMRDNACAEQIEARMGKQMCEDEKRSRADYCIVNDGEQSLDQQIDELLNTLRMSL